MYPNKQVKFTGELRPKTNENMKLTELFSDLQQCIELGLIIPEGGAKRAIDAICVSDKTRKFTMDELRELLADYPLVALGLEQLVAVNFYR